MSVVVRCQELYKQYRMGKVEVQALRGISCTFRVGFNLLIGQSGSGKSTLLNLIGSLDAPTSGSIEVAGTQLGDLSEREATVFRRRYIGFIFQSFSLIPTLNVYDNVCYPLFGQGVSPPECKKRVARLLEQVELPGFEKRFPQTLSGGQQQRVAIARALISQPRLILADEPTASLDSQTSARVFTLLERLAQDYNSAIILASHDYNVIKRVPRVLELVDGQRIRGADDQR